MKFNHFLELICCFLIGLALLACDDEASPNVVTTMPDQAVMMPAMDQNLMTQQQDCFSTCESLLQCEQIIECGPDFRTKILGICAQNCITQPTAIIALKGQDCSVSSSAYLSTLGLSNECQMKYCGGTTICTATQV